MALIRPISPSGRISGLILKNIRNISIVQGPTPLMVIRSDFIVSSLASKKYSFVEVLGFSMKYFDILNK